jgi:hypothetical protein
METKLAMADYVAFQNAGHVSRVVGGIQMRDPLHCAGRQHDEGNE